MVPMHPHMAASTILEIRFGGLQLKMCSLQQTQDH